MSDLGAGGVSASMILATLQDLVRATYAEVAAIKANLGQAASGDVAGGDLSGFFPDPSVAQIAGIAVAPGVWTPSLRFGGAVVGITYGAQSGAVIRIGKLTIAFFAITLTSKGVSVGAATIEGLPAACGALAGTVAIASHAAMAGANVFECSVAAGTTIITLGQGNAVASAALADTDFTNTTAITGAATYLAA